MTVARKSFLGIVGALQTIEATGDLAFDENSVLKLV